MKISRKILITFIFIIILPVSLIGYVMSLSRGHEYFENAYNAQMVMLNNVISLVDIQLSEAESNVNFLGADETILIEDDSEFTSFLNANPDSFEYDIKANEQKIIDKLYEFKISHTNINSIYMGRENGSFLRSHRRASPTQYDPRIRPWYTIALSNPDKVNFTEAYKSVTTDDINIGVVKTIRNKSGTIMGVIGMDITLDGIRNLLSEMDFIMPSELNIISSGGKFLAKDDPNQLFEDAFDYNPSFRKINETKFGHFTYEDDKGEYIVFYDTYDKLGWKFLTIIDEDSIYKNERRFNYTAILLISVSVILSVIALLFLERSMKKDIDKITETTDKVLEDRFAKRIEIGNKNEFAFLSAKLNDMLDKVESEFKGLEKVNRDSVKENQRLSSELSYSNKKLIQKEKQALLGMMTNNVIDEISAPIDSCITGATFLDMMSKQFSDELEREELDKSKLLNFATIIQNNTGIINENLHKSGNIINRLKSIAHSSDTTTNFNIYEVIYNNYISLYPEMKSAKLEFEIIGDKDIEVVNNKNIFNQIIINLLMTSLSSDFINEIKKASIEYELLDKKLKIRFKDNSIGMDSNIIKKLKADETVTIYESESLLFSIFIINTAVMSRLNGTFNIIDTKNRGYEFIIEIPL